MIRTGFLIPFKSTVVPFSRYFSTSILSFYQNNDNSNNNRNNNRGGGSFNSNNPQNNRQNFQQQQNSSRTFNANRNTSNLSNQNPQSNFSARQPFSQQSQQQQQSRQQFSSRSPFSQQSNTSQGRTSYSSQRFQRNDNIAPSPSRPIEQARTVFKKPAGKGMDVSNDVQADDPFGSDMNKMFKVLDKKMKTAKLDDIDEDDVDEPDEPEMEPEYEDEYEEMEEETRVTRKKKQRKTAEELIKEKLLRDHPANENINPKIRLLLLTDENENSLGEMSRSDALKFCKNQNLDLVMIVDTSKPPVARATKYEEFIEKEYERLAGVEKQNKENAKELKMKEIRFRSVSGSNDIQNKLEKAKQFLLDGKRVKISVESKDLSHAKEVCEQSCQKLLQMDPSIYIDTEMKLSSTSAFTVFRRKKAV